MPGPGSFYIPPYLEIIIHQVDELKLIQETMHSIDAKMEMTLMEDPN